MSALFEKHQAQLERAARAVGERGHWSPYQESPASRNHPPGAKQAGLEAFEARLGEPWPVTLPGTVGRVGEEVSPYTLEPLGVSYPAVDVELLYAAAHRAWPAWRDASEPARAGVCMEWLARLSARAFELTFATQHTTGQGFLMAFAGSGANSLDRGLEALAVAWLTMQGIPRRAAFERSFGGEPVRIEKRYRLMPRGVAVVISCGSYPAWNAYPAITANLMAGNPVVVKPHPDCILPMAIAVETGRALLAEQGFPPDLLTLAADTWAAPVTKRLLEHPDCAVIDFTGGQRFGDWIEQACRHARVYTETAGCNAGILESCEDLDGTLAAIANGLCAFSGQLCTTLQNLYVPAEGVRVGESLMPVEEVEARLVAAVDEIVSDPRHAAGVCGAVASPRTLAAVEALAGEGTALRPSAPYAHPEHPRARTATPLILRASTEDRGLYGHERFGPMSFFIRAESRERALACATRDARERGAIASYVWSTDAAWREEVERAFFNAGASVGFNLRRQSPINYAAAFSDFHVTGLNPAGSACLTDPGFVTGRFGVVQSKLELP